MRLTPLIPLNDEERELLEKVYFKYRSAMFAVAFSCLHNDADAEDIVHQVFLKLAQKYISTVRKLQREETLPYYLMTMTRNEALSHLRKASVRKESIVDPMELPEASTANDPVLDDICESLDTSEIAQAINRMDDMYRNVLYQRFIMNLTIKEIADINHLPISTVKGRLQRAKCLLWSLSKEKNDNE